MHTHRLTQRDRVYKYILGRRTGATRAETSRALRIPYPSACRRIEELLADKRVAVAATRRRQAEVLVADA